MNCVLIASIMYKPDVICIVETWLDKSIADCEIAIPNYTSTRLDRDRHGGGIAIYVANHLSFSVVASGPFDLEFLVIPIKQSHGKLGISLLYRLPSVPTSFFDTFSSSLENLNILYFLDVSKPSPLVSNFCNIINSYNLILSNTGHTRTTDTTATTIDVMLSSTPSLTRSCDIIPPLCSSDHNSILAYIVRTCATQRPPQHPRLIWQYDHADFNLANELLSQVDMDSILMEDDINTSWAK